MSTHKISFYVELQNIIPELLSDCPDQLLYHTILPVLCPSNPFQPGNLQKGNWETV